MSLEDPDVLEFVRNVTKKHDEDDHDVEEQEESINEKQSQKTAGKLEGTVFNEQKIGQFATKGSFPSAFELCRPSTVDLIKQECK